MTIKALKYMRERVRRCKECDKKCCPERGTGGFCDNEPVYDYEIIQIINELILYKEREGNEESDVDY